MDINADVHSIKKLKDYFFLVPDYQREYVWKVDDQVEQFLEDIDNEYDEAVSEQHGYFIGSIIIVKNKEKYDVIDGQQRLTTLVLTLCAFRDLLKNVELDQKQRQYFKTIEEWLSDFDIESDDVQIRLELQYDESKDFLTRLILEQSFQDEETASIKKMQDAYERIKSHLMGYLDKGVDSLIDYARYFLTKIELVLIESENLSSALKIFETINQRGAGLNAMDLVKNLLFSKAKEKDFQKIKEQWRDINANLKKCGEDDSPLRFLRYFLMARYHDGILREDEIYKWVISPSGKKTTRYEDDPKRFASELVKASQRYADLVNATMLKKDGGGYPFVTRIGFINKFKSRQHLVLLLALPDSCDNSLIEYLAEQLESYFFFSTTIGIQSKYNERSFTQWAVQLRRVKSLEDLIDVVNKTLVEYLKINLSDFRNVFMGLRHYQYNPLYRQRYILGRVENTIRRRSGLPEKGMEFFDGLQIEHILPQTPRDDQLTDEFQDREEYESAVYMLGNVSLLESSINQAVNNFNDLRGDWFRKKQSEYVKSDMVMTKLLNHEYGIGKDTQLNRFKLESGYKFTEWNREAILSHQKILMEFAFDTWRFNGVRLDQSPE